MISEPARRIVMIGAPVTGVRTPPLLAAFLAEHGAPAEVPVEHVEPADLAAFMARVRAEPSIDGLMVTMPHKRAILPFLDDLSDIAKGSGSVNAVKRVGGRLLGAQFDGVGLANALTAAGADIAAARVVQKGLGGAGLVIALTLLARGVGSLAIAETDAARVAAVAPLLSGATFLGPEERAPADILVNATPLGMVAGDPSPFAEDEVAAAGLVADIVSDPYETRLATLAAEKGVALVTGRQMVASQVPPIGRWLLTDDLKQDA